jgi:hypothetical protein
VRLTKGRPAAVIDQCRTGIARAVAGFLPRRFREAAANRWVRDDLGQLGLRRGYGRLGLGYSQLGLRGASTSGVALATPAPSDFRSRSPSSAETIR